MALIDVAFRLSGDWIPVDHGYGLYVSLCSQIPGLRGGDGEAGASALAPVVAVHPVRGRVMRDRKLQITPESRLTLRLPVSRIEEVLGLAGRQLEVGGQRLHVLAAEVSPLRTAPNLYSGLVVVEGVRSSAPFLERLNAELAGMGVRARAIIPFRKGELAGADAAADEQEDALLRRSMLVRDEEVCGFAVNVNGLTGAESLTLQEVGLGGWRWLGCGVFSPVP